MLSRFHPVAWSKGTITIDGKTIDATGDAVFIHAIQSGMRPNTVSGSGRALLTHSDR